MCSASALASIDQACVEFITECEQLTVKDKQYLARLLLVFGAFIILIFVDDHV